MKETGALPDNLCSGTAFVLRGESDDIERGRTSEDALYLGKFHPRLATRKQANCRLPLHVVRKNGRNDVFLNGDMQLNPPDRV